MKARAGFTLLEVVLALTSLALVAAICYGAFHLGIRAVERGEVAVVTAQRLRVASDLLIRQVKSAVPYPARNRDDEVYPYFMGTATSMTFVTAAGQEGGGGLARVVYQVVDDPPRLLMTENRLFSPDSLGRSPVERSDGHATVLLDNFRSLKFEYLMNDGADTEWHPEWNGLEDEMLPAAVRVLVDGLPGLEVETWGQEIPLMATTFGDNSGEVGEEDLPEAGDENEDDNDNDPDN